jgi:hypothetical protein
MTLATRAPARPVGRKAVLFCPACEYGAPIDGDWSREDRDGVESDRTDVACPDCGAVVVSQPQFVAPDGGAVGGVFGPALQLLDAVVRHDVL